MGFVRLLFFLAMAWLPDVGLAQLSDLTPRPELTPEQVVQYQLAVLQHNDEPKLDAGIERAFRFASPSNQQVTGPLENFVRILKTPAYSPLLNNSSSSIVGSELKEDQAKIVAKVVASDGRVINYVFLLSNQREGEFINCWMTDGVAPLQAGEEGSDQGVTI
jgi:Domain of unknown function (DUF4864)